MTDADIDLQRHFLEKHYTHYGRYTRSRRKVQNILIRAILFGPGKDKGDLTSAISYNAGTHSSSTLISMVGPICSGKSTIVDKFLLQSNDTTSILAISTSDVRQRLRDIDYSSENSKSMLYSEDSSNDFEHTYVVELVVRMAITLKTHRTIILEASSIQLNWQVGFIDSLKKSFDQYTLDVTVVHVTASRLAIKERSTRRKSLDGQVISNQTIDASIYDSGDFSRLSSLVGLADFIVSLDNSIDFEEPVVKQPWYMTWESLILKCGVAVLSGESDRSKFAVSNQDTDNSCCPSKDLSLPAAKESCLEEGVIQLPSEEVKDKARPEGSQRVRFSLKPINTTSLPPILSATTSPANLKLSPTSTCPPISRGSGERRADHKKSSLQHEICTHS